MLSTAKVAQLLATAGFVKAPFTTRDLKAGTVKDVNDETYGPTSMLYIQCSSQKRRKACETMLLSAGATVQRDYWPEGDIVAVQVSYFKGWHWNE